MNAATRAKLEPAQRPQQMDIANGTVVASEVLPMRLERLDGEIAPFVLGDTPDVLTIGGRCVNEGYGFHWPPYSKAPYFELLGFAKHRKICQLVSISEVPYLADGRNTRALKAAAPSPRGNPSPTC